jgi:hypothetical protein
VEKIVASAIKFYPKDSEYPQIVCGKRHCDCYEWMQKHNVEYDKPTQEQGFLTDKFIFIDRYEAAELAWNNRQMLPSSDTYQKIKRDILKHDICNHAYPLFSEDLW